jgi:hypothetical protein
VRRQGRRPRGERAGIELQHRARRAAVDDGVDHDDAPLVLEQRQQDRSIGALAGLVAPRRERARDQQADAVVARGGLADPDDHGTRHGGSCCSKRSVRKCVEQEMHGS